MAWWKNPGAQLTPPVTRERIAAWFDAQGYNYDLSEDGSRIDSGFGAFPYHVEMVNENLMAVHGRFWTNLPPEDEEVTTGLRSLVQDLNRENIVPSLATFVDDDGRQVAATIAVGVKEGLNDDQLDDILATCLRGVMSTFSELAEAMGIDPAEGLSDDD